MYTVDNKCLPKPQAMGCLPWCPWKLPEALSWVTKAWLMRSAGGTFAAGLGRDVFCLWSYSSIVQVASLWLRVLKMGLGLKGAARYTLFKRTGFLPVTKPHSPSVMMPSFSELKMWSDPANHVFT